MYYNLLIKIVVLIAIFFTGCTKTQQLGISFENDKMEQVNELLEKGDSYFDMKQYMTPKGENAYEYYQESLKIDHNNKHAIKGIRNILDKIFDLLSQDIQEYGKFLDAEKKGKDVAREMADILTEVITHLEQGKRICEEFPYKDSYIDEKIKLFDDEITNYSKKRSFYRQNMY